MSWYRDQLEQWLKTIDVNADRVLDLGGASNPVRSRVKSWDVGECFFFDNGAEAAKVDYMPFDLNLPWLEQMKGYEAYITKHPGKNPFEFDAIFCLEVFEYIYAPAQAIKNIWELMSSDSVCYISFPTIYPLHQPEQIDYLRYTKRVILKYMELYLFQNIEIIPRVPTQAGLVSLQNFYSNEGMHPLRHSREPYDIGYLVKARKITLANS